MMFRECSRGFVVSLFALFLISHADGAHIPASVAMASKTAQSSNDLGIQLYLILSSGDNNNVAFSPFGLTMSIGTTANLGSRERKDFEELDEVLELNSRRFFKDVKALGQKIVDKRSDGVHVEFKNVLYWEDDDVIPRRDGGMNLELQSYRENIQPRKPRGRELMMLKLKKVLTKDFENGDAGMTLVNKIVFKARWEIPFSIFTPSYFYVPGQGGIPDKKVQADFMGLMSDENQFKYFDDGELRCQVIELNYGKDFVGDSWDPRYSPADVSMVIALPYEDQSLRTLEESLSPATIERWTSNLKLTNIDVSIPKFNISVLLDASVPLQELGVHSLFNSKQKNPGKEGKLGSLWQEFSIGASETGTEKPQMPPEDLSIMLILNPKKSFEAVRPFLFFIRDKSTNAILFMGRIVNPTLRCSAICASPSATL